MEEEYKMLREEIMFYKEKLHWYFSIISTAGIAFLAYIINNPNNIVLLSLFLAILVIIEGRIYNSTKGINEISAYMEVFLEPNIEGRKWETNLNSGKFSFKKRPLAEFVYCSNSICFLISIIVIVFNCIIIWKNITLINVVFSFVNLLLVIFLAYMALINRREHQDRSDYVSNWRKLKDIQETENNISDEN